MKKLPIVGLIAGMVVAMLLLAGGGYYYLQSTGRAVPSIPGTTGSSKTSLASIRDLMMQGVPQQCTFSYEDAESGYMTKGTSYISGTNVRTDFENTERNGTVITGSMILTNDSMYTWNSQEPTGIKMPISASDLEEATEAYAMPEGSEEMPMGSIDDQTEYTCSPWIPNPGLFSPPADREFIDLSEQMNLMETTFPGLESGSTGMEINPENACAVCESLPAEAAAACKSSMGCE